MRAIDAALKARIELAQQTLYNNANPQMDVTVTRPRTPITRAGFWQESIVTAGATSVCTSVCVRRQVKHPTRAYVAYVTEGGSLVVKYADLVSVAFDHLEWITVETIAGCTACAVELDGFFRSVPRGRVEFLTDETPWLFYVTAAGALMGGLLGGSYEVLAAANVTAVDAIRGEASYYKDEDQGLLLFYIVEGSVYYRQLIAGVWGDQATVTLAPANAAKIKAERVFDWRIVLQVTDAAGALYEIFARMQASGWNGTEYVALTGAEIVETTIFDIVYSEHDQAPEYITLDAGSDLLQLMSIYSPLLVSARNLPVLIEDPENPGQYLLDYGYLVEFTFDQYIPNAADYPGDFKLIDDYGVVWYGQSAEVSAQSATENGHKVLVTFNNFNNAGSPVTAAAVAGNLWNGYAVLEASSVEFTATNLVPFYVPPPVVVGISNLDARTIAIEFDKAILDIASQSGFVVTAQEPNMSPIGTLSLKTYGVSSITADPGNAMIIHVNLTAIGRLKYPIGDVTIAFTGSLGGPGGAMVDPFTQGFTPTLTTLVFNPNDPEYITFSAAMLTAAVSTVTYGQRQLLEPDYTTLSAIVILTAVLTHIDDLPE